MAARNANLARQQAQSPPAPAPKKARKDPMATVTFTPPISDDDSEPTESDSEPDLPPGGGAAALRARAKKVETTTTPESHPIPHATPALLKALGQNGITVAGLKKDPRLAKAVRKAMLFLRHYWNTHRKSNWEKEGPTLDTISHFILDPAFQATSLADVLRDPKSWYAVSRASTLHGRPASIPGASSVRHSGASSGPHITPYDASTGSTTDTSSQSSGSDSPPGPSNPPINPSSNPSENPSSDPSSSGSPSSSSDTDSDPTPPPLIRTKASIKRAEKRKRAQLVADATAHIQPPAQLNPAPLKETPTEKDRKLNLEFRKSMTNFSPKISDYTKKKDVERWCTEIEEAARVHYGSDWQNNPEVIYGAVLAMENELKDMWRDDHKRNPSISPTWPALLVWIKAHVDREIRSESRDALQQLIDGRYQQGQKAVFRYLNQFRRIVSKIPDCSESQLIQYFLTGMNPTIKPDCLTDIKGRPWKTLDALVKHAAAQELKFKARNAPDKPPRAPRPDFKKGGINRTLAVAALKKKKAEQRKTRAGKDTTTPRKPTDKSLAAAFQDAPPQAGSQAGRQGGGRGGGGGGAGGGAVGPSMPLTGDDAAPYKYNRMISEQQAKFLAAGNRCWHCYEPHPTCKADRADPGKCNLKGNSVPLAKGSHGGAPPFKGK